MRELKAAGASSRDVAEQLQYFDGDLTGIPEIQADIHDRYRTAY